MQVTSLSVCDDISLLVQLNAESTKKLIILPISGFVDVYAGDKNAVKQHAEKILKVCKFTL